jgi:shikimate dehydrogenase
MDKYGLIGYPLGHSFSAGYFNKKFEEQKRDAVYSNYEIADIKEIEQVLAENPELKGLNVTIPHKQHVMPYLAEISPEAKAIGAVNVVKVMHQPDGKVVLKGYNSDVIGFMRSIEPLLKPIHKKALILGTGGASLAIDYGLKKLGLETLKVSRRAQEGMITYDDITAETLREYPVIVNCSPVGMYPHVDECPQLPYEAMNEDTLLYDLVYNPEETLFLKKGSEQGATVKNGLEMLILQAIASEEFWNE